MPGWRSSDFSCRVHFLVPVSTASMMSAAMLRGFLVTGLLRVVGQDDRALAAVRVLDVGAGEVQGADHRLVGVGPHLRQGGLHALSGPSEAPKRVADPDAPVRAGDELAGRGSVLRQAGLVQTEGEL